MSTNNADDFSEKLGKFEKILTLTKNDKIVIKPPLIVKISEILIGFWDATVIELTSVQKGQLLFITIQISQRLFMVCQERG